VAAMFGSTFLKGNLCKGCAKPILNSCFKWLLCLVQPFSKVDLAQPFSKVDLVQPFSKVDLAQPFSKVDLAQPFSKVD